MLERFRWHLAGCCENYVSVNRWLPGRGDGVGDGTHKYFVPTDPKLKIERTGMSWWVKVYVYHLYMVSGWQITALSTPITVLLLSLPNPKRYLVFWLSYCKRLGMWAAQLQSLCSNSIPVSNLMPLPEHAIQQPHTQAIKHKSSFRLHHCSPTGISRAAAHITLATRMLLEIKSACQVLNMHEHSSWFSEIVILWICLIMLQEVMLPPAASNALAEKRDHMQHRGLSVHNPCGKD